MLAKCSETLPTRVENRRVKSCPDPLYFPHLTRPFSFFRKNPGAGRVTGRTAAGSGPETGKAASRSDSRDPVFGRDGPGFNPDIARIFSPSQLPTAQPNY
jgi:hypothetical protein